MLKTKKSRRTQDRERKRPYQATTEAITHMERRLGRKWLGNQDGAHESALSVLCDRGYITTEMRDKGHDFAALFCMFYPIHAKSASIGDLPGRGSIGLPIEDQDEKRLRKYIKFKELRDILREMPGVYGEVINIAVKGDFPQQLHDIIALEDDARRVIRQKLIFALSQIQDENKRDKIYAKYQAKIDRVRDLVFVGIEVDLLRSGLQVLVDGR